MVGFCVRICCTLQHLFRQERVPSGVHALQSNRRAPRFVSRRFRQARAKVLDRVQVARQTQARRRLELVGVRAQTIPGRVVQSTARLEVAVTLVAHVARNHGCARLAPQHATLLARLRIVRPTCTHAPRVLQNQAASHTRVGTDQAAMQASPLNIVADQIGKRCDPLEQLMHAAVHCLPVSCALQSALFMHTWVNVRSVCRPLERKEMLDNICFHFFDSVIV